MLKNNDQTADSRGHQFRRVTKPVLTGLLLTAFALLSVGCRYDMQDQPRYKVFKKSTFFADGRASRNLPVGTVPRGHLRSDTALYTGKIENPDPNAKVETVLDENGTARIASFPNAISEFPVAVTEELLDRGEQRYKVFCMACHGPVGNGDGMIVRRGFVKPPTFNDDRLRNAPVGHFFDVITNGQGQMGSYGSQVPVADRWAIVAYIRALQISQKPDMKPLPITAASPAATAPTATASPAAAPTGGAK